MSDTVCRQHQSRDQSPLTSLKRHRVMRDAGTSCDFRLRGANIPRLVTKGVELRRNSSAKTTLPVFPVTRQIQYISCRYQCIPRQYRYIPPQYQYIPRQYQYTWYTSEYALRVHSTARLSVPLSPRILNSPPGHLIGLLARCAYQ